MALGKGDSIGVYQLLEDFRVAGGRSRISFAAAGGKRWFVKEFLSPKYPTPDSPGSEATKAYKRQLCEQFENHQHQIMMVTRRACSAGSNLVCAQDLIRVNASYYKITEAIDTTSLSTQEVAQLPFKEVIIIMRSLASSLRILHNNNIVHGDLKPENILIKKTQAGIYTTKLIDLDDSYFSGQPAEDRQSLVGTPEYYAPEVYAYISDEDEVIPGSTLTCKADIYTLGLIFVEYLTGQRVQFDHTRYAYAYAATLDDQPLQIPSCTYMTWTLRQLIRNMLALDAEERPGILEVFNTLKSFDATIDPSRPTLRGTMLRRQ